MSVMLKTIVFLTINACILKINRIYLKMIKENLKK